MSLHRDERGVIVNWLVRIVLFTAIVGVILFDAGAIAVNFFGLDATADDIAVSVSNTAKQNVSTPLTADQLEAIARKLARESDARLVSFEYDEDNHEIFLTVKRSADTLIVSRIGPIEDWAKATAEAQASTQ